MSYRPDEILESFGQATGARRWFAPSDGFSFTRLRALPDAVDGPEFAALCQRAVAERRAASAQHRAGRVARWCAANPERRREIARESARRRRAERRVAP